MCGWILNSKPATCPARSREIEGVLTQSPALTNQFGLSEMNGVARCGLIRWPAATEGADPPDTPCRARISTSARKRHRDTTLDLALPRRYSIVLASPSRRTRSAVFYPASRSRTRMTVVACHWRPTGV
jgi:hypothetical protein